VEFELREDVLRRMLDVIEGFVGALARLFWPFGLDEEVVLEVAFEGVLRVCC